MPRSPWLASPGCTNSAGVPVEASVAVGNRMLGERLSQLVSLEALKLAASAVLLSPFIPLLFMSGLVGRMFREFALTVTAAILISVVASLMAMVADGAMRRRASDSSDIKGSPGPDCLGLPGVLRATLPRCNEARAQRLWEVWR